MSIYRKIAAIGPKFVGRAKLFKYGFNYSPMYRRSTGRITDVSNDLLTVNIKVPLNYKNRNYVGSIFGGSMFSAVDPVPMVQLIINLLDSEFVVWDKSAEIFFKAPAREDLYATFEYTLQELEMIRDTITKQSEMELVKVTPLTNKDKSKVFCEVKKTIYIASKAHYREKRKQREIKAAS